MLADAAGALYWPDDETLIVSDLHFEKGSGIAARRRLHIPPYDTRATLTNLERLIARYKPKRVICLGDSFHDGEADSRMDRQDCERLIRLTRGAEWIWISGNHDPAPPECFGGTVVDVLEFGPLTLLHKAESKAPHELSGHYHPKASIARSAGRVSGRCFVIDARHLIMPAFGAYTGGLNVLDEVYEGLLSADFTVAMIGRHRIVHLPRRMLCA